MNPSDQYNPNFGGGQPLDPQKPRVRQSEILDGTHPQINNFDKAQHNHETLQGGGTLGQHALIPLVKTAPMHISGGGSIGIGNIQAMGDGVTSFTVEYGIVPQDYHDGDLTIRALLRPGAAGTAVIRLSSYRMRASTSLLSIDASLNYDTAFSAANAIVGMAYVLPAANFQAGDVIRIDVGRLGADGADTLAAGFDIDMMWMEYTGYP